MMSKTLSRSLLPLLMVIFTTGCLLPESRCIPVAGATSIDWNPKSFWYYPWGRSGTHKGIDIFAKEGVPVVAASSGLVIYAGNNEMGGNFVLVMGAKWRSYYYAHLQKIQVANGQWLNAGDLVGNVGTTGNAQGKPPHLHFSIHSLWPILRQFDFRNHQAWNKMFYVDPNEFLAKT